MEARAPARDLRIRTGDAGRSVHRFRGATVNPIASCAEAILRRHAHPALRLSELVELVAEQVDRALDAPRLRAILEEHPERFRILDPWRGPWRSVWSVPGAQREPREAWVVVVTDPAVDPAERDSTVLRLRESVRWLGRGVDPRSPTAVSRWYAIALTERETRRVVARRVA